MAETFTGDANAYHDESVNPLEPPKSVDEARVLARLRFKERVEQGEKVGNCDCHTDESDARLTGEGPIGQVVGLRFLDSGQTYFFDSDNQTLAIGDWVVAETTRGKEAGRVVLAPHQIRLSQLKGDLKPIIRRLDDRDIEKMNRLKRDAAEAVKIFGQKIREQNLPMKPISAEYSFDGSHLTLNFSAPDRVDFRELARELASSFRCRIELRQVGARDEARLLGGMGRCGRTLCCASWLPIFPEVSMGMAKTQDLPLNPQKVSGVCGRLLCCLSYENEQYRQMKAVMPRLGQTIETQGGPGMVVAMQVLREAVTIRFESDGTEATFTAEELGLRQSSSAPAPRPVQMAPPPKPVVMPEVVVDAEVAETGQEEPTAEPGDEQPGSSRSKSRRRRRSRGSRNRPQA
jgi:cell fate regulator YaaT (PSP1 superfamily)